MTKSPNILLAAAVMACCATSPAPAGNTYQIKGPDKVLDGWVSTGGPASFDDDTLRAGGAAWGDYHRVLLRFDLAGIDPAQHAQVKKAVLRLPVTAAENPSAVQTAVAASDVAWTDAATFASPDGTTSWPSRESHSNLDYAMLADGRTAGALTVPGTAEFDVTAIVARWLFLGGPNNGFIVATGPTIWGRPDAGTWKLDFAASQTGGGPELVVEMEGAPPTPETARSRALALYPSPLLPPVRDPYVFVWYGAGDKMLWEKFEVANMITYSTIGKWLAQRGALDLTWGEGSTVDWLPDKQAWERYYIGLAANNLGFCMHEWHIADPDQCEWAVEAARAAERAHPSCYSAFYFQGQDSMARLAGEGGLDLLITEGYTHVIREFPMAGFQVGMDGIMKRIDAARRGGAIGKHVVMLGHIAAPEQYHPGHELTPAILDEQIAAVRAHAPEMPGIGFYYIAGGEKLAAQADALAGKHFVEPAPEVTITEPAFEAELSTPHVLVKAVATPQGGRTIAQYRWFIDNRLVAETTGPEYLWDLRGESPGRHFVTVHAVDSGFNRAAAQIPVRVAP